MVDKYLHADARSSTSALLVKYPIVVDVHITASSQERSASHTCQVTLSGLPMSVPGYRLWTCQGLELDDEADCFRAWCKDGRAIYHLHFWY